MKITIICEVLGAKNNGTTVAAYNLIDYLKSQGHDVTVVCPDEDKRGQKGFVVLPKTNLGPMMQKIFEKNCMTLPRYDEKILTEAIKDADVVHIMIALFISRKTSKLVKRLNKPLTAGFHGQAENVSSQFGCMWSNLANHIIYKWYDNNVFCRADAIHYPTEFIRDVFEKEVKRKTPGYVISNGVNSIFKPTPSERPQEYKDKYCIAFTGRLSTEKSHKVLIKAVSYSKYKDKIQLLFAGNGPKHQYIQKIGSKLPNPPVINFYSREDLVNMLNYCDLYCHPAEVEIEAIACLEAICCGLVPIIADSPKCATKVFSLDSRCLFKVNDARDLANKIDYFIENPQEKEKLRTRYLSESISFEQQGCMKAMEQMLEETVRNYKK